MLAYQIRHEAFIHVKQAINHMECYLPGDLHHHPCSGKPPRLQRAISFNRHGYLIEYLAETVEVLAEVIPPVTVVLAALLYIEYLAETVEVLAEVIPPVMVVVAALLYIGYLAETVEVLAEVIPPEQPWSFC